MRCGPGINMPPNFNELVEGSDVLVVAAEVLGGAPDLEDEEDDDENDAADDEEEEEEEEEVPVDAGEIGSVICPRNAISPSRFRSPSGKREKSFMRYE
jgi:hypothetical protein